MSFSPIYTLSIQPGETPTERRFVWTAERSDAMYLYYEKKELIPPDARLTEKNAQRVMARITPIFGEAERISATQ